MLVYALFLTDGWPLKEPFGNYLCQKLIEHCDDTQRDTLVDTVAPDLLKISLNMHGTRAVQKLVEFLSTPHQVSRMVILSLSLSQLIIFADLALLDTNSYRSIKT